MIALSNHVLSLGRRAIHCTGAIFGMLLLCGCQTVSFPPMNTGDPAWRIQQGQAVWRPDRTRTELAGELIIATHNDGRSLVQFTKTPLPMVTAQTAGNAWRVEFGAQQRVFSGRGKPPQRVLWLYLPRALQGAPIPPPLTWTTQQGNWTLSNPRTGESIEGYLNE